jgi:hypothetical protein
MLGMNTKFSSRKSPLAVAVRVKAACLKIEMQEAARQIGCSRAALYQALGGVRMGPTVAKIRKWLLKRGGTR